MSGANDTPNRSYSVRKGCETLQEAVPISLYCRNNGIELRKSGAQLVSHCPHRDHEDKTPSFTVWGDRTWHCFGCDFGHGYPRDVVSLHMILDGHKEMWSAMVDLSMRYGVELPRRRERWHERQNEKTNTRNALRGVIAERYREKLFHLLRPLVVSIWDPADRKARAHELWIALWPVALDLAERRLFERKRAA